MHTMPEIDGCWVCDNWLKVNIFWNPAIGRFNDINSMNVDTEMKKSIVQTVRLNNPESYTENGSVPILYSNITQWKGISFTNVLDYLNNLEYDEVPMA